MAHRIAHLLATGVILGLTLSAADANPLSLSAFSRDTGIRADAGKIQQTWNALEAMGTTKYLGGMLGGFKLDEASMIAGAMSIGASEFDALLNGQGINTSVAGAGQNLISNMQAASGIDLSSYTGSFTQAGGGDMRSTSLYTGTSAMAGSGSCDPTVAAGLVALGKEHVDKAVNVSMSGEYGFSQMGGMQSNGKGTGFGAMSCLDKLFQNAGSDILFKPPSLGSLTTQIQNWSCSEAVPVAEQIASAFGQGEIFNTPELGGFFPSMTFGEANDGNPLLQASGTRAFGTAFASFEGMGDKLNERGDLMRLFR